MTQEHQGYLHTAYASSLSEFGAPIHLERSGGWLLARSIPSTSTRDLMGTYPLFCCLDWQGVSDDLRELGDEYLSVAAVTDPMGEYTEDILRATFDRVMPFKTHYVADTSLDLDETVSKSHRRIARRALKDVAVEICTDPMSYYDEWIALFETLTQRHAISGLRAFSKHAFATQLSIPGITMFRASHAGETVGLDLWYAQGDVAQGHLVAFSDLGYKLRASYATKWTLSQYFSDKVRWINFGGVSGTEENNKDSGLAHFKGGWSNTTRKAYFCGSVLNPKGYEHLSTRMKPTNYFPAYRAGEFS